MAGIDCENCHLKRQSDKALNVWRAGSLERRLAEWKAEVERLTGLGQSSKDKNAEIVKINSALKERVRSYYH